MSQEQEVRLQFLDEAQDYIDSIESRLLGLSNPLAFDVNKLDTILRSAHSIKGGAAMMSYPTLSDLAHRLEDFFKVIRATKACVVDKITESLLLEGVDCLRQCLTFYRRGVTEISSSWLSESVDPLLSQLRQLIGEPNPQDEIALLSEEVGEDLAVVLFQSEVEGCLQRLEQVLATPGSPCLREECQLMAQELGGLGEMLELTNFSRLCESINQQLLKSASEEVQQLVESALHLWRRSQALVFVGQSDMIPTQLEPPQTVEVIDWLCEVEGLEAFESEDFSFWQTLTQTTEAVIADPEVSALRATKRVTPTDFGQVRTAQELEVSSLTTYSEALSPKGKSSASPQQTENTIRVSVQQLEQLGDLVGELTIERNGLNLYLSNLRHLVNLLSQRVKTLEQSNQTLRDVYDTGVQEIAISRQQGAIRDRSLKPIPYSRFSIPDFDRLEMDRYNPLHVLFQELMETSVQIQEVSGDLNLNLDNTQRTARQLTQISQQLQQQLTGVRMRPFSSLVGRFPRAVRDMALKYDKPVNLKITGGNVLIDKSILEALSDPIMHLLRNAFDHGIEESLTRTLQGKPAEGTLEISAAYRGNQTVIILRDDGAGIDFNKIGVKALEMGLTPTDLEQVSQQDLLNLIFEPGFSTAKEVTDLSGRGIGMDIVRTQVQQVRGQIQVDTKPGKGTTFTITVPFTLSVVRVLLVESGGLLFAFPTYNVEEVLVPTPQMKLSSAGQDYLNWEGQLVPLVQLKQWLRFERPLPSHLTSLLNVAGAASLTINQPTVLMCAYGNQLVALEVESYWGEQEVTIRMVEGFFPLPAGFTGCTILGDGRVVPLVDVYSLLTSETPNGAQASYTPSPSPVSSQTCVMVVDDSINVRRFLALTLEKAGYRVVQAKDGQEALVRLKEEMAIAAVICDIEMPQLDGYGFLTHVRSGSQFHSLPVLMLTSRSGEKHRQIALNLGATAYFTKPFQEQELLSTLKSVINVPTPNS